MSRTIRPGALVAALAAGFVLAAPLAAGAHVGVSPDEIVAGDHAVLTFSFAHGCEDSPTTALRITMPEGLASVAPTMDGDWTISSERGADGLVSSVTYTAVTPVPGTLRGAVSMAVGLDEDSPESLVFPVEQLCVDGSTSWTEVAEKGEDPHSLDAPAPVVNVVTASTAHGAEAPSASADASPLPLLLGAGGLVVGLVAVVIAALAYRRAA